MSAARILELEAKRDDLLTRLATIEARLRRLRAGEPEEAPPVPVEGATIVRVPVASLGIKAGG